MPILLINAKNGKGFRIVLHAYVMGGMAEFSMLIGWPSWIRKALYKKGGWEHVCNFGKGTAGKGKRSCSRNSDVGNERQALHHTVGEGRTVNVLAIGSLMSNTQILVYHDIVCPNVR